MKDQARKTWIVVANGANARIFLNRHQDEGMTEVPLASADDPRPVDFASDVHVHHKPEHKPTNEQRNEGHFLDLLAGTIQTAVERKVCDQLVLVAPATAMGRLRNALNKQAMALVVADLVHDYTHQNKDFIYAKVKDELPL